MVLRFFADLVVPRSSVLLVDWLQLRENG